VSEVREEAIGEGSMSAVRGYPQASQAPESALRAANLRQSFLRGTGTVSAENVFGLAPVARNDRGYIDLTEAEAALRAGYRFFAPGDRVTVSAGLFPPLPGVPAEQAATVTRVVQPGRIYEVRYDGQPAVMNPFSKHWHQLLPLLPERVSRASSQA